MAKLIDMLKPGMSVLLDFPHGLGDCIMFLPVVHALRRCYPDVLFAYKFEADSNNYLGSTDCREGFDLVFPVGFPMSEGSGLTKPEKCCLEEIGLDYSVVREFDLGLRVERNPYVLFTFCSSCHQWCTTEQEKLMWDETKEAGFLPMELYFEGYARGRNKMRLQPFVTRHVRDVGPDLHTMVAMLQNCHACISVVTGTFCMSLALIPERTLVLEHDFKLTDYAKHVKCARLSLDAPLDGKIKEWLLSLDSLSPYAILPA